MTEMIKKWRSLGVVITVLAAVVALGMFGGGQLWNNVYAEGRAAVAPTGGNGAQPGTIVPPGTGTGKVMPAALSGSGAAGQVTFWTGTESLSGDNDLYWDNTNKRLGIGTASPLRKLHYYGDAALFQRSVDAAGFIIQRTDTNRWVFGASENPSLGTGFSIYTYPVGAPSATPRLFLDLEGRVGIGTISPDSLAKLHVVSSDTTTDARAVYGETTGSGSTYGVYGKNTVTGTVGILGSSSGVFGKYGTSGPYAYLGGSTIAVHGIETSSGNFGDLGRTDYGAYGKHSLSNNEGYLGGTDHGVYGLHYSSGNFGHIGSSMFGVYGSAGGSNQGVRGESVDGIGVKGFSTNDTGVEGTNTTTSNYGQLGTSSKGVYGNSSNGDGVYGTSSGSGDGVHGYSSGSGVGVYGNHSSGNYGYLGGSLRGVFGYSSSGYGVRGQSSTGYAGYFEGKVKVDGSLATAFRTEGNDYTLTATDSVIAVDAKSKTVTVTLPSASGITGRAYTIKKIDDTSNVVDLKPDGSEEIDGVGGYSLSSQWDYVTIVSNGGDWLIVAEMTHGP